MVRHADIAPVPRDARPALTPACPQVTRGTQGPDGVTVAGVAAGAVEDSEAREAREACALPLPPEHAGLLPYARGGLSREEVRAQLIEGEASYAKWGFNAETTPAGQALSDHLFEDELIEWNRAHGTSERRSVEPGTRRVCRV